MIPPLRVWAPTPRKVELEVGGRRTAMTQASGGWWEAAAPFGGAGTDYGFVLDGTGPLPDPRSPWQPNGVHGLSRLVDHASFRWTDQEWRPPPWPGNVIYEMHVGTFTPEGTFAAAIGKLDHIAALGATCVDIMPVNEFSGGRNWGYDGVDLYAPHHAYGGPEGLKKLVDACHARGLAVVLDVVYNHIGPVGNYLAQFGPYFTKRHASPWGEGINFDQAESVEVRRFFCDNALMWLRDYHFDGLRLDAVHGMLDTSAIHFLEQLGAEVKQLEAKLGRTLWLIPESDLNDPRLLWPRDAGGFGLDAQWSDDFHHALHGVLTGERQSYYADFGSLADLADALRHAYIYRGGYSPFRHRNHGRPADGLNGSRFLGYLQNHDQAGNRPQGERSSHLLSSARLKIGAAVVLTSPFIPMLFQGEEWGARTPFLFFTDHADMGGKVREGRLREFGGLGWAASDTPDPQAQETFERSKLDWAEPSQASHAELLEWHKKLIQLRLAEPALCDGEMHRLRTWHDDAERWFAMERHPFVIAFNLGPNPRHIPLCGRRGAVRLASVPLDPPSAHGLLLPPDAVAIVKLE